MAEYHVYCIDNKNRIHSRHYFNVPDDLAALEKAKELCGYYEIETWQGSRLIARLAKDGTANLQPEHWPRKAVSSG